ncbi:MAG: alpha-amylase [Anaerolinea sp.]|nr:alpha-amylase [Anaerolinea sp.]
MPADKLFVYEINTWVWLNTLSRKYKKTITLSSVPNTVLDEICRPGIDVVWLMGVWKRSALGRTNALQYKHEYVGALPDITDDDIIGSAYSIGDYRVDERLGGRSGLASFRKRLRERGVRLLLDFVPNHVGKDHRWVHQPDFIIRGKPGDLERRSSDFFAAKMPNGESVVLAHGRDPLFPGWSDTAQLNIFNPELRREVIATLLDIASQCDGVRCDMAMLLMTDIFAGTWRGYVGAPPPVEYWREVIPAVRELHPKFLFIAEVYWNKEYDILQQGFDYAYDKVLYDRIVENDVQKLRQHLLAGIDYQQHMIRFVENHDEPRAFAKLGARRSCPAATLICTLPGATLLHEGQFSGRTVKLPVQISRQPDEKAVRELEAYYLRLLEETRDPIYQQGEWYLFDMRPAWNGNITNFNMLAYGWQHRTSGDYRLIVVNLTEHRSQGRVGLGHWRWLDGKNWRLFNVLDGAEYDRHGGEMTNEGLYIDLDPYESHIFRFEPAPEKRRAKVTT